MKRISGEAPIWKQTTIDAPNGKWIFGEPTIVDQGSRVTAIIGPQRVGKKLKDTTTIAKPTMRGTIRSHDLPTLEITDHPAMMTAIEQTIRRMITTWSPIDRLKYVNK